MRLNRVNSAIDRNERNKINENFDVLERSYGKSAIDAQTAKEQSDYAIETSDEAKQKAESVQTQFNQVVIEGDSSVEAAQARVSVDDTVYTTLKERLDAENTQVTQQLAQITLDVSQFGAKLDGLTDDTQALIDAHDALPSSGGRIFLPSKKCKINGLVNFTKPVVLQGTIIPTLNKDIGSTILLSGNGEIYFRGEGSGVENVYFLGDDTHTKNGVNFLCARPWGRNIMTGWVGQDGIVIGSETEYANVNSFHFQNLRIKDSGRHGLYIVTKDGQAPDANAGMIIGADIAGHTNGNPIQISNAHMNTFLGIHCENNIGVDNNSVNVVNSNGNVFLNLYTEGQGGADVLFDANSSENMILGMRSGVITRVVDTNNQNVVLKRYDGIQTVLGKLILNRTGITNPDISGRWEIQQNGTNRNLEIKLLDTSAAADIDFSSTSKNNRLVVDKLRIGSNNLTAILNSIGTTDFGTVNAKSTKTTTRTINGAAIGDYVMFATNGVALPNGITVDCYVSAVNTVTLRAHNFTDANITVGSASYKVVIQRFE